MGSFEPLGWSSKFQKPIHRATRTLIACTALLEPLFADIMKTSFILLICTAISSALAADIPSFSFGSNKFSRQSMTTWQQNFATNEYLGELYRLEITPRKIAKANNPDFEWLLRCPRQLRDADIKLIHARGSYKDHYEDSDEASELVDGLAKKTGTLNHVIFDYLINNGECGKIRVYTDLSYGTGMLTIGYHWKRPEYEFISPQPGRGFSVEDVQISAGTALDRAKREMKDLKYGFISLTLSKRALDGVEQPVYTFKGIKGQATNIVYVSARDGKVVLA